MKLYTKDLILRTVTEEDIDEISRMWEYPNKISKQNAYKALEYMNRTHAQNRKNSICHLCLAVFLKDEPKQIVGWCGLDGEAEPGKTVLFYVMDENYRNKGYATQCAEKLLKYVFEDMEYDVIYGGCDKENYASYRVMQKIGMEQTAFYDNSDPIFVMNRETYFRKKDRNMNITIEKLKPEEFEKCSNIWDMKKHSKLAKTFYEQLVSNNRITYVYKIDGKFIAEASIVFDMSDSDYTIAEKRVYFSRFLVKKEYQNRGIGTELANFVFDRCREMGYAELSVGVDIDNFRALKLYQRLGFDKIIFVGEDSDGKYLKLTKNL